jgi:hypothetical protein
MRTTVLVLALAFLFPACDGSVNQSVQTLPAEPSSSTGGGSTTSSTTTVTSSAASSSSTGGAGGASSQFCDFTVTGAIDVSVTSDPQSSGVIGSMLSCGDDGASTGILDSLGIAFTATQGPGTYASSAAPDWFQHAVCSDPQSSCDPVDTFGGGPGSSGCTVVLTVAPDSYQVGALVAGSFSCPALVGQSDPTQSVSVSGTFSTVMRPLPC